MRFEAESEDQLAQIKQIFKAQLTGFDASLVIPL
jgi:hypothetical protein